MITSKMIKSWLYIVSGTICILFFASSLLFQLFFILLGLYFINLGLQMRGVSATSFFMRAWMGNFR